MGLSGYIHAAVSGHKTKMLGMLLAVNVTSVSHRDGMSVISYIYIYMCVCLYMHVCFIWLVCHDLLVGTRCRYFGNFLLHRAMIVELDVNSFGAHVVLLCQQVGQEICVYCTFCNNVENLHLMYN